MSKNNKKVTEGEVGYGQPPKSGQFKKGQSGNLNGRPKKKDLSVVDLGAILTLKMQVNGEEMDSREVELRQQIKKALDPKGPLKSMQYVIEEFEQHSAMKPPDVTRKPLELPSTMEFPWAFASAWVFTPWSAAEVATARSIHLESRNGGDRIFDAAAGHKEWLKLQAFNLIHILPGSSNSRIPVV